MNHAQTLSIIEKFIVAIERLVPEFMQDPDDTKIANGNVVLMKLFDGRRRRCRKCP